MFGHTLRGWLAESLELATSSTTFPYKNYNLKPFNFDGFINYYRLNASESRDNKIIFYLFLFFFSMKSKTRALCVITISLLTKPPWPKHKMSFCQWATSCGFVLCSESVEKWFGLWKIPFLCSEKNQKSRRYGHECNVCFSKPMYIKVVILLRSFNPPNVAKLKIYHVSIVVWYKHFGRRLIIQALWSSLDNTSTLIIAR